MKSKQSINKKTSLPFVSSFLSSGFQRPQNNSSIDWSINILTAPTSLSPCVPPAEEHMSLPHVPLPNMGSSSKNKAELLWQLLITRTNDRTEQ